jgi:hypothetical protein
MMIAAAAGLSQKKAGTNGRFPKACAGLYRARYGFCRENLLGSFREETVGIPSLFRIHTSAQGEDYLSPYNLCDPGKSGFSIASSKRRKHD